MGPGEAFYLGFRALPWVLWTSLSRSQLGPLVLHYPLHSKSGSPEERGGTGKVVAGTGSEVLGG